MIALTNADVANKFFAGAIVIILGFLIGFLSTIGAAPYIIGVLFISLAVFIVIRLNASILLLYFVAVPLFPFTIRGEQPSTLMLPFLLLIFFVKHFRSRIKLKVMPKEASILIAFYALNLLGLLRTESISYTMVFIVKFTISLVLFFVISNLHVVSKDSAAKTLHQVIDTLLMVSGIMILYLSYQYLIVFKATYISVNIDHLTTAGRNQLAFFLALFAPFAIYRLLNGRVSAKSIWPKIGGALLLFGLIMTLSRGAWLSVMASLIYIGIMRKNYKIISGILIAILIVGIVLPSTIVERFVSIKDAFASEDTVVDGSTHIRKALINISVASISEHPIFGIGLGNFYKLTAQSGLHTVTVSHNDYLLIAVELGLIALVVFGLFLLRVVYKLSKFARMVKREHTGLVDAILGSVITLVFYLVFIDAYYTMPMWIILGFSSYLLTNWYEDQMI